MRDEKLDIQEAIQWRTDNKRVKLKELIQVWQKSDKTISVADIMHHLSSAFLAGELSAHGAKRIKQIINIEVEDIDVEPASGDFVNKLLGEEYLHTKPFYKEDYPADYDFDSSGLPKDCYINYLREEYKKDSVWSHESIKYVKYWTDRVRNIRIILCGVIFHFKQYRRCGKYLLKNNRNELINFLTNDYNDNCKVTVNLSKLTDQFKTLGIQYPPIFDGKPLFNNAISTVNDMVTNDGKKGTFHEDGSKIHDVSKRLPLNRSSFIFLELSKIIIEHFNHDSNGVALIEKYQKGKITIDTLYDDLKKDSEFDEGGEFQNNNNKLHQVWLLTQPCKNEVLAGGSDLLKCAHEVKRHLWNEDIEHLKKVWNETTSAKRYKDIENIIKHNNINKPSNKAKALHALFFPEGMPRKGDVSETNLNAYQYEIENYDLSWIASPT